MIRAPIHFSIAANVGDTIYIDNLRIVDVANELASRNPVIFEADSGELGSEFSILQSDDISYVSVQTTQSIT